MKKSTRVPDTVAGIDFGTTKICVAVASVTPTGLEIVGIGKQPSHGIRKGVVVNIAATVDATRKALEMAERMAGVHIKTAVAGIAGSHIKSFNSSGVIAVRNQEVGQEDLRRALDAAQAVAIPSDREVLHVIPQEFRVNDQEGVRDPLGMSGVRLEAKVHMVTGAMSSAQNIRKCAKEAGVQLTDIVLESLASAESVLTEDEKELGVVLLDMGGGTTDFVVYSRGSVVHSGVIAMGGNHITNDIAVGLRTSIQDAEKIKIQAGSATSSVLTQDEPVQVPSVGGQKLREVSKSVLHKIIEPRVEEIFELINQELVNAGLKHLISSGVVITGGGSLLEGMCELGEFILEMPVRRGFPQPMGGLVETVDSPVFATALGLTQIVARKMAPKGFQLQDMSVVYSKIFGRVRHWLGEVF